MLVIGVDDAGRGPLIGPMMLGGVLVSEDVERELKEKGVKDSKALSHPIRVRLAETIKELSIKTHVVSVSPIEIDNSISSGVNLNTLEAKKIAEVINELNPKDEKVRVVVDCPSVNTKAWCETLRGFIYHPENLEIRCEHKADVNHPSVSAGSILAKVMREEAVSMLKDKYGEIGSGYPSDPNTVAFLQKHGRALKDSGIFRKSWATWKALFPEKAQTSLESFKAKNK